MLLLRMLHKHKIKVYVCIDDQYRPIVDEKTGLVLYRDENRSTAPTYTTLRSHLTLIPGVTPVELDASVTEVKPPRPRKRAVTHTPEVPAGDMLPPNTIIIYTDGGASPNPGPAGSGVLMMYGGHSLEIWEYLGRSTNNIAELTAILRALENIKQKDLPILLYTDSSYALGVLTGRMRASKNVELVEQTRREMAKCPHLQILKVKAHIGITYNEHVDRLVALARDRKESGSRRSSPES